MNRQSAGKTIEIIKLRNEGKTIIEIAKELAIPYGTVSRHLRKEGLASNRKSPVFSSNLITNYFEVIDSEDKAYFLGFIKADGYVDKKRYRLAIRISEIDIEILKRFCDAVNIPIQKINRLKIKDGIFNRKPEVEIAIYNKDFVSHILNIKDSSILDKVPEHLAGHFIRGYFDGDGSISFRDVKAAHYQMNIMGSPNDDSMLKFIQKFIPFNIYMDKRSNLPLIQSSNRSHINQFRDLCYDDCYIYLTRKKTKFDMFKFLLETSTTLR